MKQVFLRLGVMQWRTVIPERQRTNEVALCPRLLPVENSHPESRSPSRAWQPPWTEAAELGVRRPLGQSPGGYRAGEWELWRCIEGPPPACYSAVSTRGCEETAPGWGKAGFFGNQKRPRTVPVSITQNGKPHVHVSLGRALRKGLCLRWGRSNQRLNAALIDTTLKS